MKYQRHTGRSDRARLSAGAWLAPSPDDRNRYTQSTTYTPERMTAIMDAANSGDTQELCIASREIMERNWDIAHAFDTRVNAVSGCEWTVEPGGGEDADRRAAEAFEAVLRDAGAFDLGSDNFYDLVRSLMDAVIYPFAASEILWTPGGGIEGFRSVGAWFFTMRDSFEPRLVTDTEPCGMELPAHKIVFHRLKNSSDPARCGRIRTLAWLHIFQNLPIKDLMSFVERYGMPFVVAHVDQNTWDNERAVLKGLIRSFGPSGGGVFTKSTELELLQAANTSGDVYFRLLEYTGAAITKVLLGQTASSSDGTGLSGGGAQGAVRQDILESDARAIEATVRAQIAAPWTRFNFADAAIPLLKIKTAPPADEGAFATVISTLFAAGLEADPAEVGERLGLKLTRRVEPAAQPNAMGFSAAAKPDAVALASDAPSTVPEVKQEVKQEVSELSDALTAWLSPLENALADAANEEDDSKFASKLAALGSVKPGDSSKIEKLLEKDMLQGVESGVKSIK